MIRAAAESDLPAICDIYNHYVRESVATFDESPREGEKARDWFRGFGSEGPHRLLVAEANGKVVGYAHSGPYRAHPAFAKTVETSVYVAPHSRSRAVGSKLYAKLFSILEDQSLHRALAGIALPNPRSVALHRRFGFRIIGTFDEYAQKGEQRISSIWMEKSLSGEFENTRPNLPPEFFEVDPTKRPAFIRHAPDLKEPLGRSVGLSRIGIHYETLNPKERTSVPHAESDEEEFVYVLEGHPDAWIDGHLYPLKPGDAVGFPSGTGIAHTFLNNTNDPVRLLVVGEATKPHNRYVYPLDPEENQKAGDRLWTNPPHRPRGPHNGKPNP